MTMLEIQNTVVSLDLLTECFVCDYATCKGICCKEGDSGAPITEEEKQELEKIVPMVAHLLSEEALELIKKQGVAYRDTDGDLVTSIIHGDECVFAYQDETGWKCAVETAFLQGKTAFKKPISCHLYPVRLTEYRKFTAVNYHRWDVCACACSLGNTLKQPLYKFLKEPLIRKFGKEWYEELEVAAAAFLESDYYKHHYKRQK